MEENVIIEMLREGKNIALVSDAGTPCISDPGVLLVSNIYKEFGDNAKVIPIPGASALVTALCASGISTANFTFLGFIPHKKGRETLFKDIALNNENVFVFYESTHRILKTLEQLQKNNPNRNIILARELTKKFEQFKKGTATELLTYLKQNTEKQKGEFVVIVDKE